MGWGTEWETLPESSSCSRVLPKPASAGVSLDEAVLAALLARAAMRVFCLRGSGVCFSLPPALGRVAEAVALPVWRGNRDGGSRLGLSPAPGLARPSVLAAEEPSEEGLRLLPAPGAAAPRHIGAERLHLCPEPPVSLGVAGERSWRQVERFGVNPLCSHVKRPRAESRVLLWAPPALPLPLPWGPVVAAQDELARKNGSMATSLEDSGVSRMGTPWLVPCFLRWPCGRWGVPGGETCPSLGVPYRMLLSMALFWGGSAVLSAPQQQFASGLGVVQNIGMNRLLLPSGCCWAGFSGEVPRSPAPLRQSISSQPELVWLEFARPESDLGHQKSQLCLAPIQLSRDFFCSTSDAVSLQ
nr:PREDICTED: uncharacterized protein LOC104154024 [Struthio camelus australis]XP_009688504.1 PREDICTED: uncharacterized protein LOC104154024 [Struthio camelus australis]